MQKERFLRGLVIAGVIAIFTACTPTPASEATDAPSTSKPIPAPASPTAEPTPQPTSAAPDFGPDQQDFPAGINPLSGQPVTDPTLLKIPAMLVSISHFPVEARPQAGLSFAPFVYEFSITEGQSRFLAAFYGKYPQPEIPVQGNCAVRTGAFTQTDLILGNQVWLDANKNGVQDADEEGLRGVCVNLYDADGKLLEGTTTDSNGYYGFNVQAGEAYTVEFVKPPGLDFTKPNVGDENHDSDADPASGRTSLIPIGQDDLLVDAGMTLNSEYLTPTPDPKKDPKPQVGPVRSGRLLYAHIQNFYQDSCLVYAFASEEVLAKLPKCSFVAHEVSGGGEMLDLERMKAIAEDNMRRTADKPFNYASNLYSVQPPTGGFPAGQVNIIYASLNQSGWTYDPLYQAWLRSVDSADEKHPGVLHLEHDRLNGRQLHFENLIVLMANTDVVSPTNLDIHLDQGEYENAYLFRDGRMYPIKWSTRSGEYEHKTGLRRPIQFLNRDGTPAPLKPGHTWIVIVTPFSLVQEQASGVYLVRYAAPEKEAR